MPTLDPNKYGTIGEISKIFIAYTIRPNTAIRPFDNNDVLEAALSGNTDKRSFQDPLVKLDLDLFFRRLNQLGILADEQDVQLSEFARNYHIARVAYLCNNISDDPITVSKDLSKIIDGTHRVMAAIALGRNAIEYVIVNENVE